MFSLAVPLLFAVVTQPAPTVDVTGGTVRGIQAGAGAVFKGIPFAAPPVGALRWREPQPVKPWQAQRGASFRAAVKDGNSADSKPARCAPFCANPSEAVRDATRYSAACMQVPTGTAVFLGPLAKRYGKDYPSPRWDLSEDCLYLNIWTPEWPVKEPRAVMVWLHGGSNRIGSGNETGYDGSALARRGVVVVTINYRLGVFGFFSHPALTRESPHHASGNYGLLDQIAALAWVHTNIEKFGGDPERVTLFGESAGSIDAGMLMCSPLAAGLFQRAIMESGPAIGIAYTHSQRQAEQFGERVSALAHSPTLERLRALPAEAVMAAAAKAARQEPNPEFVLDGRVLPRSPQQVFAGGSELPVSLMIGNNGREASAFRGLAGSSGGASSAAAESIKKTLRISYGGMATMAMLMYFTDSHVGRTAAADEWLNDALMTCPSAAMAALNTAAGRRSFVYQFRRSIPGKGQSDLGSFHSLELPYVFGALGNPVWDWLPFEAADTRLAEAIQNYWTNFAKTGDPNGPGLPRWQDFTPGSGDYLEFGADAGVAPRRDVRPTWCSLDISKLKQRLNENR